MFWRSRTIKFTLVQLYNTTETPTTTQVMAPIRIAIIGLSSAAKTGWAANAHLPYLLSPLGRSKYTIVALCNSSTSSAQRAIEAYNLPQSTKAYGDPVSLAEDKDVDLVVCCTRVDTHYELTRPSVERGKHTFTEWPLTHELGKSEELERLVREKGTKSMVGHQGRLAPVVVNMRELVEGGRWGRVLSCEVRAFGGTVDRETISEGLTYFADRKIGGNVFMIGFAHLWDTVQAVVGEATDLKSRLQLQRPIMKLRDPTGKIVGTTPSDVPDLIIVNGSLNSSASAQKSASLSIRYRRGQPFKGEPALTWYIHCERGEIRLISPSGSSPHANSYDAPVTIDVHDFATDEVHSETWEWNKWQEDLNLPIMGRSVASLYEAFYDHVVEGKERTYPDFEDAVVRHRQLDSLLKGWAA
ncbi:NAD(P)-binding protein [Xylariaceae sp. FL1272]|nr:NAD(P)-binding protein [Xylariaceae sp. FL1272]